MRTPEELQKGAVEILESLPENLSVKDRTAIPNQEMPSQDPADRIHNMFEVALGYTEEEALVEANRCLNCKNPRCVAACPVSVKIPQFISEVAAGNFAHAAEIIAEDSSLPAVCGRVCPQENQCEKYCVRGKNGESVGIGRLERFVADRHNEKEITEVKEIPSKGKKVAVITCEPQKIAAALDEKQCVEMLEKEIGAIHKDTEGIVIRLNPIRRKRPTA